MTIYSTLLNKTVDIYSRTPSSNALGEVEYTWSLSDSDVTCRLVPITAEERVGLTGEFKDVQYKAYFLSSQTITTDNRIKYNDSYFTVVSVYKDSEDYTQKAYLRKL